MFNEPKAVCYCLFEGVGIEFENFDFGCFDGGCASYEFGASSTGLKVGT